MLNGQLHQNLGAWLLRPTTTTTTTNLFLKTNLRLKSRERDETATKAAKESF